MPSATICPLCGASNECGVAAGKSSCWCFSETIPESALAQVPEDLRGSVCICAACARKAAAAPVSASMTPVEDAD